MKPSNLVLCTSPDGWSLHAPGSTDEEIASGDAPYLASGEGEPTEADYDAAYAKHIAALRDHLVIDEAMMGGQWNGEAETSRTEHQGDETMTSQIEDILRLFSATDDLRAAKASIKTLSITWNRSVAADVSEILRGYRDGRFYRGEAVRALTAMINQPSQPKRNLSTPMDAILHEIDGRLCAPGGRTALHLDGRVSVDILCDAEAPQEVSIPARPGTFGMPETQRPAFRCALQWCVQSSLDPGLFVARYRCEVER